MNALHWRTKKAQSKLRLAECWRELGFLLSPARPRTRSKCSLRVSPHGVRGDQQCLCRGFYHFWQRAYAGLSQFEDAWRCIDEAMTAVETTKERWCEAEVHRVAGEIALLSQE